MKDSLRCARFLAGGALGLFVLSAPVSAQDRTCTYALVQDVGFMNLQESSSLVLAEWFYRSRNFDSSWASKADVPIKYGKLGLSHEQAEKERERLFHRLELDWTHERIESVLTQTLSDNAVRAYEACLESEARDGVRILAYKGTEDRVTIEVEWTAAAQAPRTATNISIVPDGGTFDEPFPNEWESGEVKTRYLFRTPDTDARVRADIGPDSNSVFVSRLPRLPDAVPVLSMAKCRGRSAFSDFWFWGPAYDTCNGLARFEWGSYDEAPQAVIQLGKCVGKGGSANGITFWGPVGEDCLWDLQDWGTYQEPVDVSITGIASCIGQGNFFAGHRLYGPKGEKCGGIDTWGHYAEHPVLTNAEQLIAPE